MAILLTVKGYIRKWLLVGKLISHLTPLYTDAFIIEII